MVLVLQEAAAIADGMLPVAQLAAQMRLPEGYGAEPARDARLCDRLRAAVTALEGRLGVMLLLREATVTGPGGVARFVLPVSPAVALVSVEQVRGGVVASVAGARLEADGIGSVLVMPWRVPDDATVRAVVRAGWDGWQAMPAALGQAVLTMAEALDTGEVPQAAQRIRGLIAPWRRMRVGGAV